MSDDVGRRKEDHERFSRLERNYSELLEKVNSLQSKVTLVEGEHQLTLDKPQRDLVARYVEAASWRTSASRRVVALFDWFNTIEPAAEPS